MIKIRLDEFVLQKGFALNIQVVQSLIMQGKVHNKHEGNPSQKQSTKGVEFSPNKKGDSKI